MTSNDASVALLEPYPVEKEILVNGVVGSDYTYITVTSIDYPSYSKTDKLEGSGFYYGYGYGKYHLEIAPQDSADLVLFKTKMPYSMDFEITKENEGIPIVIDIERNKVKGEIPVQANPNNLTGNLGSVELYDSSNKLVAAINPFTNIWDKFSNIPYGTYTLRVNTTEYYEVIPDQVIVVDDYLNGISIDYHLVGKDGDGNYLTKNNLGVGITGLRLGDVAVISLWKDGAFVKSIVLNNGEYQKINGLDSEYDIKVALPAGYVSYPDGKVDLSAGNDDYYIEAVYKGSGGQTSPHITINQIAVPYTLDADKIAQIQLDAGIMELVREMPSEAPYVVDAASVAGIKGVALYADAGTLLDDDAFLIDMGGGVTVTATAKHFAEARAAAKTDSVTLEVSIPSLNISFMNRDKEIDWRCAGEGIIVTLPYADGEYMADRLLLNMDGKPVARSWYENDRVVGIINRSGKVLVAVGSGKVFSDVAGRWMEKAVTQANMLGIAQGISEDKFAPSNKVTRAQFATFLMRAMGLIPQKGSNELAKFTDSSSVPTWAREYFEAAISLGIITGTANGKLSPNTLISRQDMFLMIQRAVNVATRMKGDKAKPLTFTDADSISAYALEAIAELSDLGIANGTGGKINPKGKTSRAEAIQVIANVLACERGFH